MFGDQIPDEPIRPEPMDGHKTDLRGHELLAMEIGQSDAEISTILYVPSLNAVVAGDIANHDVHVNVAATNRAQRQEWIGTLNKIGELNPQTVVGRA